MSDALGWKIKGFYDGKVLVKDREVKASDCVFLDMEILRPGVRSVGQHMLAYNYKTAPTLLQDFKECISANALRSFDFANRFIEKYPFGTIHLLLPIVGRRQSVTISEQAVAPLLYTDGTFKNLFNYPENCLRWLTFLGGDNHDSPLHAVFKDDQYSLHEFMTALRDLFNEFDQLSDGRRGGDKIVISDSSGDPKGVIDGTGNFDPTSRERAERLLKLLSQKTGWQYQGASWSWQNLEAIVFSKMSTKPLAREYKRVMEQQPLSLAITSRQDLQFTVDPNGRFK